MNVLYSLLGLWLLMDIQLSTTNENEYVLSWQDQFDQESINMDSWSFQKGDGCPHICGWGNNELQYYTDHEKNARLENGILVIEAHNEDMAGYDYSSAKLVTNRKVDFKYGKIEIRAKLPVGTGTWSAFWMLPTLDKNLDWPGDGEIDIMEHVGFNANMIYGTIHTKKYNHIVGTQKSDSILVKNVESAFHTYAIEWDEDKIEWFVDGKLYNRLSKGNDGPNGWPFNQYNYYLILNLAVGGNWGGKEGVHTTTFPHRMEIDYVKYYQKKNL